MWSLPGPAAAQANAEIMTRRWNFLHDDYCSSSTGDSSDAYGKKCGRSAPFVIYGSEVNADADIWAVD